MPKIVEYPKHSIKKCLQLADAVFDLGSKCSSQDCASKLGVSLSGGFNTWISSAVKFGLITHKKGEIETTSLYGNIKFSDSDKNRYLMESFLAIELYKNVKTKCDFKQSFTKETIESILAESGQVHTSKIPAVSNQLLEDFGFLDIMPKATFDTYSPQKKPHGYEDVQWMTLKSNKGSGTYHRNEAGIQYGSQFQARHDNQVQRGQDLTQYGNQFQVRQDSQIQSGQDVRPEKDDRFETGHGFEKGSRSENSTQSESYYADSAEPNRTENLTMVPTVNISLPAQGMDCKLSITSKKDLEIARLLLDSLESRLDFDGD